MHRKVNLRKRKSLLVAFLAAVLFSAGAVPAFAGTAYSSWGSYAGHQHRAEIRTYSTYGNPSAVGGPTTHTDPAGWVGVLARGYASNGSLIVQTGYSYNNVSLTPGALWSNVATITGNGAYYASGTIRYWINGAYVNQGTTFTPNQNIPG